MCGECASAPAISIFLAPVGGLVPNLDGPTLCKDVPAESCVEGLCAPFAKWQCRDARTVRLCVGSCDVCWMVYLLCTVTRVSPTFSMMLYKL